MSANPWVRRGVIAGFLLAALLVLQVVIGRSASGFGAQIAAGSCVNLALTVAVYTGGFLCGAMAGLAAPFGAYLLGVGPALFRLAPFVALGNLAYVSLIAVLTSREKLYERCGAVGFAAIGRLIVLWATILRLVIPSLGLPEEEMVNLGFPYSWPQILSALIGGCMAAVLYPSLQKFRPQPKESLEE